MIYIGIGSNLATALGGPLETCRRALALLQERAPVTVEACSPWYRTAPVPASDQPWFVNGVAAVRTGLDPEALLAALLAAEAEIGRVRQARNAPRGIDLDLLDNDGLVREAPGLILPHPRMAVRAFVLAPLADIAPDWRHPVSGEGVTVLLARALSEQTIERFAPSSAV